MNKIVPVAVSELLGPGYVRVGPVYSVHPHTAWAQTELV